LVWWKKPKYTVVGKETEEGKRVEIPDGLMTRCPGCNEIVYKRAVEENLWVCPLCRYHFRIGAWDRIRITVDEGSFIERDEDLLPMDPLGFPGYRERLERDWKNTGLKDAAVVGEATIGGYPVEFGVTDFRFLAGSMGSVVGEKVTRAAERAFSRRVPLVLVLGSGGGARMYEGILSLMQMAKTSAAIGRLDKAGIPYIAILTDANMAGVQASFGSLADVTIAEPKAMIGFTGPRVIEQTLKVIVSKDLNTAEFQMRSGMIDMIVDRREMRDTLIRILRFFSLG
jgi:acetyl-CoA carboxylase carboxyl transferase subunit beta